MIAQWKKFNGSEEQISEIDNAKHGYKLRYENIHNISQTWESDVINSKLLLVKNITHYLILNPHPHADMIIEWARTGREVYWFNPFKNEWELKLSPHWFSTDKYSFNPDGDGK